MNVENELTAIVVNVGEEPKEVTVKNEVKELQDIVGGYLESLFIASDRSVVMLLNEEGKLLDLKPNIDVQTDVIVGNVVIVGVDSVNGEFRSLTDEEVMNVRVWLDELQIK